MKRLIDATFESGSAEDRLAELVRSAPRLRDAPFARRRIRERVVAAGARLLRARDVDPARRRTGWAVVAAIATMGGVAVAAVLAHGLGAAAHLDVPPPPLSTTDEPAPTPESTSTVAMTRPDAPPARAARENARPPTRAAAAKPAASDGEDPTPVLDAIRALRSEGDPGRAGMLLSAYLLAHPRGVLTEDAMALSIESAIARHDARAVREWARQYMRRFPRGRYATFAARSVDR